MRVRWREVGRGSTWQAHVDPEMKGLNTRSLVPSGLPSPHTSSYLQYDPDEPLLLQSTGVPQEELEGLLHASPVLAGVAIG